MNEETKYAINIKRRKLHKESCYYIHGKGDGYKVFQNIDSALSGYKGVLSCCGHCLKEKDYPEIHKRVQRHNSWKK